MSFRLIPAMMVIVAAGCQADQETFDAGADLDAPPAVETAPATPITSETMDAADDTTPAPMDGDTTAVYQP